MRKILITLCAFAMLVGFAVSGAMAQVTWIDPYPITPPLSPATKYVNIEYFPLYTVLTGKDDTNPGNWTQVVTTSAVPYTSKFVPSAISGEPIKSVVAPPAGIEFAIDADTVAMWDGTSYVALDPQPFVPTLDGEYKSIAVGNDGTLYVLFEANAGGQHLLVGESIWDEVTVRFTPRALNTGSNGRWVTCKISDFPDQYTPADVNLDTVCIVAVNGKFLSETTTGPICSKDSGGPSNNTNKNKLIVKFDRHSLASFIYANQNEEDPEIAVITVAGYSTDGSLQFYGVDDTIKTILKEPKGPKKPKK